MMKKLHRNIFAYVAFSLLGVYSINAQTVTNTTDHSHAGGNNAHTHAVSGMDNLVDDSFSMHFCPCIEGEEIISVKMAPNPTSEHIGIAMSNSHIKSIAVYNLEGKRLLDTKYNSSGHTATLDVSNLSKGLMIIQIETDNGKIHSKRFMKK